MKSVKFSALVAVAVIAASCAKEGTHSVDESDKVALEPMCIEASDESQTKTVLDGKSVNWTDGDEIAVYSNIDYTTGYRFASTDINGSNSATFSGKVPAGTESFFAVYPPERVVSVSAEGVTVNIPANQNPAAGTFAEEHNITVAQGTKTPGKPSVGPITFNNVCSYVKFTVPAYVSDVTEVKITSSNDIAGDFATASSKIVSNGTNSISMSSKSGSFGAGETFIFVIAPGTVSNFSIDITAKNGNWTRTVSKGFDAKAGVPVNLGTVDFKIASMTATATHTYDGKTLTGTNLVIDNLNIPDHLTGYVKNVHIEIIPEGKTDAVRSADIRDFSTQTSIAVNSETYPYLPKGTYTIKSTYTMSDGTTSRETTGSFQVDAPTFSVNTPSAHTSYDTYITSGAGEANKEDGSTIYGVAGNGVSISDDILNNTEYKSLIGGYSFTIDNTGTVDNNGNATNQTWDAHKVFATYTFDGVPETSSPCICHVTGLPYKVTPPTKTGDHKWSATRGRTNIDWNTSYVQLNAARSTSGEFVALIQSPSFHILDNINISASTSFIMKSDSKSYNTTLNMYIGGSKSFGKDSNSTSEASFVQNNIEGTLTTSKPYVEYEAYRPLLPTSISNYYAKVTNVELYYR